MKAEKMNEAESAMFNQVQELSILCAKAIVKISDNTHMPPKAVADLFLGVMQEAVNNIKD